MQCEVPVSVCLKQLHRLIVKACSVGFCTVNVYIIDGAHQQERWTPSPQHCNSCSWILPHTDLVMFTTRWADGTTLFVWEFHSSLQLSQVPWCGYAMFPLSVHLSSADLLSWSIVEFVSQSKCSWVEALVFSTQDHFLSRDSFLSVCLSLHSITMDIWMFGSRRLSKEDVNQWSLFSSLQFIICLCTSLATTRRFLSVGHTWVFIFLHFVPDLNRTMSSLQAPVALRPRGYMYSPGIHQSEIWTGETAQLKLKSFPWWDDAGPNITEWLSLLSMPQRCLLRVGRNCAWLGVWLIGRACT